MKRYTNQNLPRTNPFRTVYIGTFNGRTHRVARCTIHPGTWRLDVHNGIGWESGSANSYPTRNAAIAAFKALPSDPVFKAWAGRSAPDWSERQSEGDHGLAV